MNEPHVEPHYRETPARPEEPAVRLLFETDHCVNFAMQQNDVPIVKRIVIENELDRPLRGVRLRIEADLPFCEMWEKRIDLIHGRSTIEIDDADLSLSALYLADLTEKLRGTLTATLFEGPAPVVAESSRLDVLSRNEWGGLRTLPEILAAFVLPNDPAVQGLLAEASDLLAQQGLDRSFSGYQSKSPRRAFQMAASAYAAIASRELIYANPPASFEQNGQKIRLPTEVLGARIATCLDLTVLAAACLEQMGLHPTLILLRDHAILGVWLEERTFPLSVVDDLTALRTRIQLEEICVFDPTVVTSSPSDFARARREAEARLTRDDEFEALIDVARARTAQIRPLPERVPGSTDDAATDPNATRSAAAIPDGSHLPERPTHEAPAPKSETPQTRIDRWRMRLLDLSMNNRLLAFRKTKKTIPILCNDLGKLEDLLAGGATLQLQARPREMSAVDPRDADAFRRRTGDDALDPFLTQELASKRLHTDLSETDLSSHLLGLYREDRTLREEGGSSALYLGVGFLSWFETSESEKRRVAPLLLLPVDLQRASLHEPYRIQAGADEPRLNVTLIEMLKRNFGMNIPGLDPLPEDDSGLDVPLILRRFREAIRDVPRWEVLDTAWIGIFSFAKFLLWRDLSERANVLLENAVVRHLVERSGEEYGGGQGFPDPAHLDDEHPPASVFCPLPADSSQLSAVVAAADGKTFVLQGPPGTGKSQTITNLIAHCVAHSQTVLFVSEKMAALDVVHERLQASGIGPSTLELHSSKATKADVYRQLEEARRRWEPESQEEWERVAQKLQTLRRDLNRYADELHKRRANGLSIFQATSNLIGLRSKPKVALRWGSPDEVDADQLDEMRTAVEKMATAGVALGGVEGHAWSAARRPEYSPGWEETVRQGTSRASRALERVGGEMAAVTRTLGVPDMGLSESQLAALDELCLAMISPPRVPNALVCEPGWQELRASVDSWVGQGRERDALRGQLLPNWKPEVLEQDLGGLSSAWKNAEASWWPASGFRRGSVRRALRKLSVAGAKPSRADVHGVLATLFRWQELERDLAGAEPEAARLLGRARWNEGRPEWGEVERSAQWADTLRRLSALIAAGDLERARSLRDEWVRLADEGADLLTPEGPNGKALLALREALQELRESRLELVEVLDLDAGNGWGPPDSPDALGRWRRSVSGWNQHLHQLAEWCNWLRAKQEAIGLNLAPLVSDYELGRISTGDLTGSFEHSFLFWWRTAVLDREPVLAQFFSAEHERKIDDFRETDDRYTELTRSLLTDLLAGRVPQSGNEEIPDSEFGVLTKETKKKRRHLALRQLFQRIPNLLPALKPCLLMSPMSVAQYLSPDHPPFDLVVFDEASQIPVWDAIGVLARGKQAVIVGDPKQLPPTTFFQRSEGEAPDIEDDLEDLESILDDCIAARIPTLDLAWHYRSRHESLIAFSNYHYYGNRLLTFPSPDTEGRGVSWRHVSDGVYDRGKSRTNRREADEIVKEITRRLRSPELSQHTIGVVTFNQAQRDLIENLLEDERRADDSLEPFFSRDREEPLFVKNLENVQGDERDVILFSITYGPESMNFGPMNKVGGERRLNVAVTRAKEEVVVFSTLRADDIDLARSRAQGVKDLKNFLEYAERGVRALAEARTVDPAADFDSPFEEDVYHALAAKGWMLHKQVGCSGYRIDLAVVDPDAPGRYLLGIECDGANYHRAKTARDRDKLREAVLRDLGWEIHRIWSTDWWRDPERETEKVLATIDRIVEETRAAEAETAPDEQAGEPEASEPQEAPSGPLASAEGPMDPASALDTDSEGGEVRPGSGLQPYEALYVVQRGDQEAFRGSGAFMEILGVIEDVVEREAPILLSLATRRVLAHWGFERVRDQAAARVDRLIPAKKVHKDTRDGEVVLWPESAQPDGWRGARGPALNDEATRAIGEVPICEIADALHVAVGRGRFLPRRELIRETIQLFGGKRLGAIVVERVDLAVERELAAGRLLESEHGIRSNRD